MSIDKIIVAIASILGIAFTYWFFLGKKDKGGSSDGMDNMEGMEGMHH